MNAVYDTQCKENVPEFFCQKIYQKWIIIIFLCFSYIIYSVSGYFLLTGDFIQISRVIVLKNKDTEKTTNYYWNIKIVRNVLRNNSIHLYRPSCETFRI